MLSQKFQSKGFFILVLVIAGLAVYTLITLPDTRGYKHAIEEQEKEIKKLEKTLVLEREVRLNEASLRNKEKAKSDKLIADLKKLKREDSLIQIRTVKALVRKYKKLSESSLDSTLMAEYEKSINSTTP